ncbi:MAG: hypothetical protein P8N19_01520 [Flavobacteriales bacterium]|nr:hypothetical protein [Flavobacteriales bacterium]
MRKLNYLVALCALLFGFQLRSQVTGLEVEVYQEHTGFVGTTDLTGFTTYRLYAVCTNENDFISAITGLNTTPLQITTTTSFFQSPAGANSGASVNPIFFGFVPDAEFDSWVTIGRTSSLDPGNDITLLDSPNDPWISSFGSGGDIVIDGDVGGGWFTTFGASSVNGFAGPDLKVLLGQFTTDGLLSGVINIQCFFNGTNDNDQRFNAAPFSSDTNAVFGCTNPAAINYNPAATIDDGSCSLPCSLTIDGVTANPPSCANGSNGSIQINASGGQGGTFYQLNGGNQLAVPFFNNLSPGTYDLVVSDSQGCTATESTVITNPAPLVVSRQSSAPALCNGTATGTIIATSTGGTGDVDFGLSPGVFDNETGEFTNVSPGAYTIYGIDEEGCLANSTGFTISQPSPVNANVISALNASCTGVADGQINMFPFGGTPPYSYSLDNGETIINQSSLPAAPGNYTILVFDANSCQDLTPPTAVVGSNGIGGCTNPLASNFDPGATCDDGSCIAPEGCTNASACNYDATATIDDGSCLTLDECGNCGGNATSGCTDSTACNFDPNASCDDDSCEFTSCAGCTDVAACNYDATATIDDGSCLTLDECGNCGGTSTSGCTDSGACNFDPNAACDDGSCTFPSGSQDCDGVCVNDCDNDGICDEDEIEGCTYSFACNFNPNATDDDGSCEIDSCSGCTYDSAMNYDSAAIFDDGSCIFIIDSQCPGDFTGDNVVGSGDLMIFLSVYGTVCE